MKWLSDNWLILLIIVVGLICIGISKYETTIKSGQCIEKGGVTIHDSKGKYNGCVKVNSFIEVL